MNLRSNLSISCKIQVALVQVRTHYNSVPFMEFKKYYQVLTDRQNIHFKNIFNDQYAHSKIMSDFFFFVHDNKRCCQYLSFNTFTSRDLVIHSGRLEEPTTLIIRVSNSCQARCTGTSIRAGARSIKLAALFDWRPMPYPQIG